MTLCLGVLLLTGLLLAVGTVQLLPDIRDDYEELESPSVVSTPLGKLRGKREFHDGTAVDAYLAVPYARPPLGDLRFKRPQPAGIWNGTRDATRLPPACLQYTPYPFPWYYNSSEQSEDCLYLNVWVPSTPTKRKAVMFWIHGGGFFLGSSSDPLYDGKALAATGDVIVVTVNYRLNVMGFLYAGIQDAPGNAGLYDILLALKWVHDNVDAFGGDPERITIFGESAGAVSVGHLCLSRLARGLFKRAILQSGSPLSLADGKELDLMLGQKLAGRVGCADNRTTMVNSPNAVVRCLRAVPAKELARVTGRLEQNAVTTFLPSFTDELAGLDPAKSLNKGDFSNVDILIGVVKDEGSFLVSITKPNIFGFFGEKDAFLNSTLADYIIRQSMAKFPVTEKISRYYLSRVSGDDPLALKKQIYTAAGDFVLTCPTLYYAEKYAERGNSVYFYSYEHRPTTTPWAPQHGVAHFEDVQFVFGKPTLKPEDYERQERALSKRIMKIWSDFAKTGYPDDDWPLYTKRSSVLRVLDLNEDAVEKESPYRKNCDFLRPYFGMD